MILTPQQYNVNVKTEELSMILYYIPYFSLFLCYYIGATIINNKSFQTIMNKDYKIDDTDIAIIQRLQQDGRIAYADIASKLGLAASTVQQRANRMIDSGVLKIRAVTDPMVLGVPIIATIGLKVEGQHLRDTAKKISDFEEIGWVAICTGPFDILAELACKSNDHLIDFIESLSKIDGVRSTETFLYLKIEKNTFQWGLP
jgi:Lrp/AsnC family transcriptional regulator for asnA, asnC and gidA